MRKSPTYCFVFIYYSSHLFIFLLAYIFHFLSTSYFSLSPFSPQHFCHLVELRKQLSGYETSLSTCNRKAAVKIRSRISILKLKLADCVSDGINAKKVYTDSNIGASVSDKAETAVVLKTEDKNDDDNNKDIDNTINGKAEVDGDVEVDNSIVDRGSELLLNILSKGRPAGTVEEAWERVILAEKMRFNLNALYGNNEDSKDNVSSGIKGDSSSNSMELNSDADPRSCLSSKYVTYVNQNYNSVKRIAAVLKQ